MIFKKVSMALVAAISLSMLSHALAHRDREDEDNEEHEHRRHHAPSKKRHHFYYRYLPAERGVPPATPSSPKGGSGTFPRESSADRAIGKQRQRAILETELSAEEQLLQNAQRDAGRTQAERSDPRQLQAHRDDIERHQGNIAALKRELSNASR